jgi:hypothetical protein
MNDRPNVLGIIQICLLCCNRSTTRALGTVQICLLGIKHLSDVEVLQEPWQAIRPISCLKMHHITVGSFGNVRDWQNLFVFSHNLCVEAERKVDKTRPGSQCHCRAHLTKSFTSILRTAGSSFAGTARKCKVSALEWRCTCHLPPHENNMFRPTLIIGYYVAALKLS